MNLPYDVAADLVKAMQIDGILGKRQDSRGRYAVIGLVRSSSGRPGCAKRLGSR
jgi:hypothetical protein